MSLTLLEFTESNASKNIFLPSKPVWGVIIPTIFLLFIFSKVIISPQGAANQLVAYQFPTQIQIVGWEFLESQPLKISAIAPGETENQTESNLILSGKKYLYQQENFTLTATIRYVINTYGDISNYYNSKLSKLIDQNRVDDAIKNNQQNDRFWLVSDESASLLTTCITPQGHSVITAQQFLQARTDSLFSTFTNPSDFWQWLKGDRLLRDQRCLWIELELKPNASQANQKLESAWQDLFNFWQANFPSIHG